MVVSASLKISEAASIAMHALILLANQTGKPINNAVIAEIFGISANHSSKVMQRLLKQGYVFAKRGPGGGYLLAVDPSLVTLYEVYTVIDGNNQPSGCLFGGNKTCTLPNCLFRNLTLEADALIEKYLGSVTLSDYANAEFNFPVSVLDPSPDPDPIKVNRIEIEPKQVQRQL